MTAPPFTSLIAAVLVCASSAPASAQLRVTVFGEGTITARGQSVYRGQFSRDGSEFWFFRKVRPDAEDYRIFVARRTDSGWSEPTQVSFGGPTQSEMYPTPSPAGQRIVFTTYRPVPGDTSDHANANLWYVDRRGGEWSDPVLMRGASTLSNYESQPWFDPAGTLHFTTTTPDWRRQMKRQLAAGADPATARWQSDPLIEPWADWRAGYEVVHATPSPDGELMILEIVPVDASGRRGTSDLWVSVRRGSAWSDPVRLGEAVNTPAYEAFAVFTPDGETLLFARAFEQYLQVPAAQIREVAASSPTPGGTGSTASRAAPARGGTSGRAP
jgi:WD40-like Beta Propeller Repeat